MAMISEVELYNEVLGSSIVFKESNPDYILESCDLGTAEGVYNQHTLVGQDGVLVSSIVYGTRTVTLICWLVGKSDETLSAYRRGLNRFINPKQRLHIRQQGYTITGFPLHTISYGTDVTVINEYMCKCLIEIMCDDPLFSDSTDTSVSVALWEKELVFPLVFDLTGNTLLFGLRSLSQIVQVTNNGDVASGMLVTFSAKGNLSGPKLINASTGEYIQVNVSMAYGEQLTIDTRGRVLKATLYDVANNPTNVLNRITEASTPLKLPVGLSSFGYTATENEDNLDVSVLYTNKYLEVI